MIPAALLLAPLLAPSLAPDAAPADPPPATTSTHDAQPDPPPDAGAADAAAADAHGGDPLAAARAALDARDPACDKRALEALQSGALDEPAAAEAWSLRGRCALAAQDPDRATRAFAAALRVSADTAPVDDDAFRRAAAERLPRSLSFEASFDGDALVLTLLGDDLQLAKAAAIVGDDGERARVPLEVGHGTHKITGVDPAGARALLFDRWGNTIARAAIVAAEPPLARAAPGADGAGPGVFTYVGAGLVGAGILGLTAASVGTAIVGKEVLEEAPLLVVGLGAGAALFVAGAGLVVVDQGL